MVFKIRSRLKKICTISAMMNDRLVLKGIMDGARAFAGPEIVQFDITNRCNNNCLCCWNNSPLMGEPSQEMQMAKEYELPLALVKETISELREMGTKTLFIAGGGEPFMHPHILEILRHAKKCNLKIFMNTNFTLVDTRAAEEIVDMKVDLIHVSLLAGTAKTYALVHPNKTEEDFYRIKELLQYIAHLKREKNQVLPVPQPHIDLYYVIFKTNYKEMARMVDLAIETGANDLEFTPMDAIPGKTDSLLLTGSQRAEALLALQLQAQRLEEYREIHKTTEPFIQQYDSFLRRLSSRRSSDGEHEASTVTGRPCYVGWGFARILANGNVNPCLKAHRITVGNIYRQSFREIWNSEEQQLFRRKSFELNGSDPYFRAIGNNPESAFGCLNSCDNIQINTEMHNKFEAALRSHGKIT